MALAPLLLTALALAPDEPARAILVMEERVDAASLAREAARVAPGERAGFVRARLESFARASQAELERELVRLAGEVDSEKLLWIVNGRRVTATPAALRELGELAGVARVVDDPPLPPEALADAPPSSATDRDATLCDLLRGRRPRSRVGGPHARRGPGPGHGAPRPRRRRAAPRARRRRREPLPRDHRAPRGPLVARGRAPALPRQDLRPARRPTTATRSSSR